MKFVDLFCGVGGSSIGAESLGLEPHLLVDNDQIISTVLPSHLLNRYKKYDLSITDKSLIESVFDADILLCSPPCQSYSRLKNRNREFSTDQWDRKFIETIIALISSCQFRLIVVENVPAFLNTKLAQELRRALMKAGLFVDGAILNAENFGVPQRRKRSIIAGSTGKIRLEATTVDKLTVRNAFVGLPLIDGNDPLHVTRKRLSGKVRERISHIPKNGGSRNSLPEELVLECHKGTSGFRDVYGRMSWDKVSPTITSGCTNPSKGRFLHPGEDRPITLREAARLQTLPDTMKLQNIRSQESRSRLIGNAFPPEFIRAVLEQNL